MRFTVKAPASSANLGPGFDALGLALDLWNTVTIDTEGTPGEVINEGPEARILEGHNNLTVKAMELLAQDQKRDIFFDNAARFLRLTPAQIAAMRGGR